MRRAVVFVLVAATGCVVGPTDEVEPDRTEDPDAHDPRPVRPAHEPLDAVRRVRELAAQFDEGADAGPGR